MSGQLPVLHIGFNKAGSTTLQNGLFALHSQIVSLGEPFKQMYGDVNTAMFNAMESCHREPGKRRPFDLEFNRDLWRRTLEGLDPGKLPVYSKESLTRAAFYRKPGDSCLPARLREMVGPARIVIVARHQIKLLESAYITSTKGHYYQCPETWFESRGSRVRMYRYYAVANSYAEVFGRENVEVFLLEDLSGNAEDFARRLCTFIGVDAEEGARLIQNQRWNVRTSRRTHLYSKFRKQFGPDVRLSGYVPRPLWRAFTRFLSGGERAKVLLPDHWVEKMESYYRADNRQLAAEWKLPLNRYDYPL